MLYLNNQNKLFALFFVSVLFTSCSSTYVRHSDLPHLDYQKSIVLGKKGTCQKVKTNRHDKTVISSDKYNWKDCGALDLESKDSTCLYFLEGKDVVYFQGSYWIKEGKDLEGLEKYENKDLNFD